MIYYNMLKQELRMIGILGDDWDLTKLPTLYISNYFEKNIYIVLMNKIKT